MWHLNQLIPLSPRRFYHFCGLLQPWFFVLSALALAYGLFAGLFLAPADYQQGDGFRIIYVHVPCAMLSLMLYVMMGICSAIYLIWRIKICDMIAFCMAPIGAWLTLCSLLTGAIWGKPMWGTWWIWDARLTSQLILLFLYLGYIGLYHAMNSPSAAKACAILAVVGLVDIPVIHYSVYWWNTLHQKSTIFKLQPTMETSMLLPLLSMILGMGFYIAGLICVNIRTEILAREAHNRWVGILLRKGNAKELIAC